MFRGSAYVVAFIPPPTIDLNENAGLKCGAFTCTLSLFKILTGVFELCPRVPCPS